MIRSDTVEERLRRALTLDYDGLPRGIDMSPRAIAERLREACEMSRVCLGLLPRR